MLIIIFCGLIINGCTIPVNFYLINNTNDDIIIVAHLNNDKLDPFKLKYQSGTPEIRFELFKTFTEELEPLRNDRKYMHYSLPPNSTFFVGSGANFKNFTFDEIQIKRKGKPVVLLNWENEELLEKGKSSGRHYAWYTIH